MCVLVLPLLVATGGHCHIPPQLLRVLVVCVSCKDYINQNYINQSQRESTVMMDNRVEETVRTQVEAAWTRQP